MKSDDSQRPDSVPFRPVVPDLELLRRIDAGNYGEVWLARTVIGALRAVKIVRRDRFETADPFDREYAGITAYEPLSRSHEGLMDILYVGRNDGEGCFHYIMELADDANAECGTRNAESAEEEGKREKGAVPPAHFPTFPPATYRPRTLAFELKSHGHLPIVQCIEIGLSLADALHYLHQHDLVHRDVKPANVIFVGGVAKLADPGSIKSKHQPHTLIGTEGFIPPEGPGRPQGDIFSLGRLLYEAANGLPAHECPKAPSDVATWPDHQAWLDLNEVICRACQLHAADRYASAAEMHADLVLLRSGKSLRRWRLTERRLARARKFAIAAVVVIFLAVGAVFYQTKQAQRLKELSDESRENLIRLDVANGVRMMDNGDLFASLVWFTDALDREKTDLRRERIHRYRIESECPKLIALGVHGGPIHYAEFSPDGRRILTASEDRTARIWDAETSEPVGVALKHQAAVRFATFSPNGERILTASDDFTARIWDAKTGQQCLPALKHASNVVHAVLSPDGSRIATASWDQTAQLWDVSSGRPTSPPLVHAGKLHRVAFSPDGRLVGTASEDGTGRVWNALTGQHVTPPLRHDAYVWHVAFNPDSSRIVTASGDGCARVWNVLTGEAATLPLRHAGSVRYAEFSHDGQWLLSSGGPHGRPGEAKIWDVKTGEAKPLIFRHERPIQYASFSADDRYVVSASIDQTVRVWDTKTGEAISPLLRHNQSVTLAKFSPDIRRILTASRDGSWRVWDLATDASIVSSVVHRKIIWSANFSRDGQKLATSSDDGTARVWSVPSLQPVTPPLGGSMARSVYFTTFSSDGRQLITCDVQVRGKIWDVTTGLELGSLPAESHAGHAEFSPDGRLIVTSEGPIKTARIWNAHSLKPASPPLRHDYSVLMAIFSPDGTRVLTGGGEEECCAGEARVWDVKTGHLVFAPFR
ncbi:MAG: protein kinase, partial [Verrucomicrobiales bacterium]|nr:protein kinase [Verrucomicrobiales bacterium]